MREEYVARNPHRLPWWRWIQRRRCPHPLQRCIHADEILLARFKRAQCLRCGRLLASLPAICSWTGSPHASGGTS